MNFLANLNEAQREAVVAPLGPWLVLAGPGTGKTRTLVARIQYLIEQYNIKPDRLLAVTYTNKATEEMTERLTQALGNRANQLQIGTFHSFCIGVLRDCHQELSLSRHFTIADEERQLRIIARVAPMLAGERHAKHLIGRFSEARLNPEDTRPLTAMEYQFQKRYETELKKNALLDFDDILFLTKRLFFEQPPILNRYRKRFDAVLIDEFQDTDRVQYEIVKQLVSEHRNLFVVADDDQSIFSWRGANPKNIDLFLNDFVKERIIVLDKNYRSHPDILLQAELLISQNHPSRKKSLHSSRREIKTTVEPVRIERFANDKDEADFIIKEILQQIETSEKLSSVGLGSKISYSDFAILYARHSVGEYLEQEMMKAKIPCQLVKGKSCFDQPEIVRTLNLLRLLYNSRDQISLEDFVRQEVDEVTYTRLKAMQSKDFLPDFRTALDRFIKASWAPEQERQQIQRVVGIITNLKLFKESGNRRLSELFTEILNSLRNQEVLALSKYSDNLTDPIFYPRMSEAAKALLDARSKNRKVLVSAKDPRVNFLATEILKRTLGISCQTFEDFIAETLADQQLYEPLVIALDGEELLYAHNSLQLCHQIVYLGLDYSPNLRDLLLAQDGIVVNPEEVSVAERGLEASAVALLFKLCQAATGLNTSEFLADYVAIDIETTGREIEKSDIIEIAAVRVRAGIPTNEVFRTLLNPNCSIENEAMQIHLITEQDVANAPKFADIVDEFLNFLGQDMLVAHNGYNFDFPIINRKLKEVGKAKLGKRIFDTLPMASRLYPDRSANLDALASVFKIDTGQRHRAYDDTVTLIEIFERLKKELNSRLRTTSCEQSIDLVAAGMLIEQGKIADPTAIFIKEGLTRLATPNSPVMESLSQMGEKRIYTLLEQTKAEQFREGAPLERLSRFTHFEEIINKFEGYNSLDSAIEAFLDFTSLYQQQDDLRQRNAVNLMTIYAAKGLEFPRVFIVGLEQNMLPSFYAIGSKDPDQIAEQRRLLYVAITRAQDQLIITTCSLRNGYPQMQSEFLNQLCLISS